MFYLGEEENILNSEEDKKDKIEHEKKEDEDIVKERNKIV